LALLDIRQRAGYLFLALVLLHIVLISAQVNSRQGIPVLEQVTVGAFSELQRATSGVFSFVRRAWDGYIGLRGVRADNEALRRALAAAEVELQQQRAGVARAGELERLLGLRERTALSTVGAEIIAVGAAPEFLTVTIDKGTRDGLATDMAVMAPKGIVGRVVVPGPRAAKVQLIVDRNAAAAALIARSRAQGVVIGTGGPTLRLQYLSEVADVVVGDGVITSGLDGIFPKGLTIGTVTRAHKTGVRYSLIEVTPAVDLSTLETVLVVLTRPPTEDAEGGGAP
jgi:rod shape-determining protein MreC